MAGNPFRRVQPNRVAESGDDVPFSSNVSKKQKKVVKIISPPPSPEETPRRRSSGRISPPPPPPEHHDDASDSDSTATADSELEQATLNTRRNSGSLQPSTAPGVSASGAPFNPFARTLATSEAAFGLQHVQDNQEAVQRANGDGAQRATGGRPAMDVDAFKNILLTGSAVPSPPASGPPQHAQDSNSSTDVSSMSRQSLFDPYFEINQETPRTSFDQMDYSSTSDDDEEGSSLMSSSERLDDFAPPAPPKHSNRKPIVTRGPQTVSFADFEDTIPGVPKALVPPVDTSKTNTLKPHTLHRSPSDLNKPLPPPPQDVAGPGSTALNAPGSTTTTTEPNSQTKKVPPPPPPASRRGGHSATVQGLGRSPSSAQPNSSNINETSTSKSGDPTSKSGPAPPPPPSRKSRPLSQSATPADTPSETPSLAPNNETRSAPMPPPPPRRNPSKHATGTSINRTPSTASRSSARKEIQPPSNHNAPAPPPPRRGGNAKRESLDGPSRPSIESERRGSEMSVESGKWNPSQPVAETAEPLGVEQPASPGSTDILADMNALQAEIDALRAKAGRG